MKFLSLFLLFSLTSSSTSTSNLVDKDLRVFRRQFNEFRSDSLLKVDQSYFEIYSAILSRISQFKKPYKNLRKLWEHTCDNYDAENLDRNVNSMLILVCEKTRNLLIGAENMDSLGLKEFFSSGLLVSSAPMTYIQNMFDAIEVEIEKIVEVYYENVTCVSPFLQQISPIFKPFVDDVVNLTKVTIQKIDKTFHHCGKFQDVAVGYVSDFIRKFKYCEKGRFLNECVRKFVSNSRIWFDFRIDSQSCETLRRLKCDRM